MANGFRSYFLAYYAVGVVITVIAVVSDALRSGPVERRPEGGAKYLLPIVVALWATLPLALILVRAGEIDAEGAPVRVLGVVLSLYTVAMEIWVAVTLGRFLVPRAVVFQEHALVTSGPYRLLRHPDYSAMLALWLGASYTGDARRVVALALSTRRSRPVVGGPSGGAAPGVEVWGVVPEVCPRQGPLHPPTAGPVSYPR